MGALVGHWREPGNKMPVKTRAYTESLVPSRKPSLVRVWLAPPTVIAESLGSRGRSNGARAAGRVYVRCTHTIIALTIVLPFESNNCEAQVRPTGTVTGRRACGG